ncbi:MAG: MerR family DNA-binding transcriptional regulator [Alphaproteobacteria bacterium]
MIVGLIDNGSADDGQAFGIAELAGMFGVTQRAIRFYEDQGLLSPKRVGKTRIFGDRDRVRLDFILRGKRLGFSLAEIREWLDLYEMEDGERRQFHALLEGSRQRITELERQRDDLDATLKELRAMENLALAGLAGESDRTSKQGAKRAHRVERNG